LNANEAIYFSNGQLIVFRLFDQKHRDTCGCWSKFGRWFVIMALFKIKKI